MESHKYTEEIYLLASIIYKAPLEKTIKWGSEVFTFNGKNVLSYGAFKNFVALWFYNGVFLSDKYNVLVSAQEGVTKSLRQWRFTSLDQIEEKKITEYILEAIEVEKKGLKIKPEKLIMPELPKILNEAFDKESDFGNAFNKLSPGKQKEYLLYLNDAKQDVTRQKRLEKIKPMILGGKGLNDKYKSC
jgi:uncharacterized protein YdeI (YjbR/CyaY-like superfamily)